MAILDRITDPVYIFRPTQILRRIKYALFSPHTEDTVLASLPWQGEIEVWPFETIGRSILHRGVHDLAVTEACFRLARPGGYSLDIGANVGQMTSALSQASQPGGSVLSFEAHPDVFKLLKRNVYRIKESIGAGQVKAQNQAVTNTDGKQFLHCPPIWKGNAGTASLSSTQSERRIEVSCVRLDDVVEEEVDVAKIDVEGHEHEVFIGATTCLKKKHIKHIIFEDHAPQKSEAISFLRSMGYELYTLQSELLGPSIQKGVKGHSYNFIATCSPGHLEEKFSRSGWKCLRST